MIIDWECRSHIGERNINEDATGCSQRDDRYCFVLCDGLGAHVKGELASGFICQYVIKQFEECELSTEEELAELVHKSNKELMAFQKSLGIENGLKTTLTIVVITKDSILYAWVGDSRIYKWIGSCKQFQSKDHSVCQKLVDLGQLKVEEIRAHEDRNRLLSVLGESGEIPMVGSGSLKYEACTLLLCSDGLWENVTELEMETELTKSDTPQRWLELLEKRVLKKAGSPMDNYSEIAVFLRD